MVKALKSMFGSDNATWMVVGVVVVILIIVVVCYFGRGKSTEQPRYIQKFTDMPERFTEGFSSKKKKVSGVFNGKPCTTNDECGGDNSLFSCYDNAGGEKEGYCALRCKSSSECKPFDSADYHNGEPTTCRGNDKNCSLRGYCVPEDVVWETKEKCCASSVQCNPGYDCRGNDLESGTLGACVKRCSNDKDCPGDNNACQGGRCLKNDQCDETCVDEDLGEEGGEGGDEYEDEGFSNYYEHFADKNRVKTAPKKPIKKVDKMRRPAPKKTAPKKSAPKKSAPKNMKESFYGGCYY